MEAWSRDTTKKEENRKSRRRRKKRWALNTGRRGCKDNSSRAHCLIQAYLGLLLVPINRDTLISLKTENCDVEEHIIKEENLGEEDKPQLPGREGCQEDSR